jgi:hypothetical protein
MKFTEIPESDHYTLLLIAAGANPQQLLDGNIVDADTLTALEWALDNTNLVESLTNTLPWK